MKKPIGYLTGLIPLMAASAAHAQQANTENEPLQEVVVTGSRIIQSSANSQQPLSIIDREAIDRTGLANIGDLLQQVTTGGKALNTKFNSSGNFGYPPDGGGIGAGSAQVDLRNLGSKRVLVLVDGIRWVNESSASGVSGAADLNTIPISIIDRIEVLEDGASAVYGSDAIAGVVNIITRKNYEGVEVNAYRGEYDLGGPTTEASLTLGGGGERFHGLFVASYFDQDEISSADWEQSAWPKPDAGLAGGGAARARRPELARYSPRAGTGPGPSCHQPTNRLGSSGGAGAGRSGLARGGAASPQLCGSVERARGEPCALARAIRTRSARSRGARRPGPRSQTACRAGACRRPASAPARARG